MISVADCDNDSKPNLREFPNYEGIAPQAPLASVDYVFNNQAFHQNMDYSNQLAQNSGFDAVAVDENENFFPVYKGENGGMMPHVY